MSSPQKYHLAVRTVFIVLGLAFLSLVIIRLIYAFSYIPATESSTINMLYGVIRMLNGRGLYSNPELPPYSVIQFMPLQYYVVAGMSQLAGAAQSIHAVTEMNRLLCLFFNLLMVIPIFRILKNIFDIKNKELCCSVYFGSFILVPASDYTGQGSLFLLAVLFAIYYFLCFLNLYEFKYGSELVLSGIFTALTFFTNQIGFLLFLGILFYLLLFTKDVKATLRFAISFALASIFLFIVLVGSSVNYWYLNIIKRLQNPIDLKFLKEMTDGSVFLNIYFVGMLGLAISIFLMKDLKLREHFLRFVILFLFLYAFLSSLFGGSFGNFTNTFLVLSLMLFSITFANYDRWMKGSWLAIPFLFIFCILNIYSNPSWKYFKHLDHWKADYTNWMFVSRYVKQNVKNDEYIFTIIGNENMINQMIGEKALFPTREIVTNSTYPNKIFSYEDFSQRVKDGKIKYIICKENKQPVKFLDAVFEGYEKEAILNGYEIYIYKESR